MIQEDLSVKVEILKHKIAIAELRLTASGRSTRIIDETIQRLFETPNEWVTVWDHHDTVQAHAILLDHIRRRLAIEHHLEVNVRRKHGAFQIKLKNYRKPDLTESIRLHENAISELSEKNSLSPNFSIIV